MGPFPAILVKVVNDNYRYYSGYSFKQNEWFGEANGPGTSYMVQNEKVKKKI